LPISSRAISPSDLPLRRIEQNAAQYRANHDPQCARQIAKLSGQRRSNQGSGARDCSKVLPEHDPFIRRLKIMPVTQALGRCRAPVIERHHLGGNKCAIKAITDHINAYRRHNQPHAVDRLAVIAGDNRDGIGGNHGENRPHRPRNRFGQSEA
jgi:hypothetical protein